MVMLSFFFANFGKSVFYYGEQGEMHGYGWKGRFFKNMLFFPQGICTFFVSCLEKNWENAPLFGCPFFLVLQGYLSKNSKKN